MNKKEYAEAMVFDLRKVSCKLISQKRLRSLRFFLSLFILTLSLSANSLAQDTPFRQEMPKDVEPPPLKVISQEERELLYNEKKVKNRTKLALELMSNHLLKAEDANSKKDFSGMFKELGRFQALIDNTLAFLKQNNNESGKVLDNFKRLEIGLRQFLPRLELIRRDLPLNYEYYVRSLIISVRDARSKAVDPLFDDSVLPENNKGN